MAYKQKKKGLFLIILENGKAKIKAPANLVSSEGPLPHALIFSVSSHLVGVVFSLRMALIAVMGEPLIMF